MSRWQWMLKQIGALLWVRAALFCVLGVATALVALLINDFIPSDVPRKVGADAVDNILQILASSMLPVTIFSLSTMVAAYSAATTNVTPRSTQLLLQDSTAQNALSVFIGAFLYSLVGIIALSMEIYGGTGRLVLLLVTIAVIVIIVVVLLRWINYLSRLGRVGETINMVERATAKALKDRMATPYLGGVELSDYEPQPGHSPVRCEAIGYLQHIDMHSLSRIAETAEAEFYLCMIPGSFSDSMAPLLYSSKLVDDETNAKICRAFSIGDARSFDQDPRFGLVVLSEIASRALSAATNDSGTAIDIIGTAVRILAPWASPWPPAPEPLYRNVHVPALETADLFEDLFAGIARDGAGSLDVGVRLQKALASLACMGNPVAERQAQRLSTYALEHANRALALPNDRDVLAALAKNIG